jgi:small-conductance mechanosensitive channel
MVLSLVFLGSLAGGWARGAQDDIVVLRFDAYFEEVEMGESAIFHISMYNNGTTPVFVHNSVANGEPHWQANVTPEFFTLYPGEYCDVAVAIEAPMTRDYPTDTATMRIDVEDLETGETWNETQAITTGLIGGGIIPERKILGVFQNPFESGWMNGHWGIFVMNCLLTAVIALFLVFVFPPLTRKLTSKTETKLDDMLIDIVRGPATLIFILLMCVESMRSLPISYGTLHTAELAFDMVFVFAGGWMIYKVFNDIVIYYAKRYAAASETELDDVLIPILEWLGAILIIAGGVAYIMRDFGIDITVLVAGMGVMGVVIGFAMQESLGNFIGGMFLLTDRPFKTGDDIQLPDGTYCTVVRVGMRTTRLYRGIDKDILILPNSEIANKPIINLTQPDRVLGATIDVGVSYDADIDKVKSVILEIVGAHPDISKREEHKPMVRVQEFADSSVNMRVFFTVGELSKLWQAKSDVRQTIHKRFAQEGIEIPYPQRVIHMKQAK